jgi:hypothetical protein
MPVAETVKGVRTAQRALAQIAQNAQVANAQVEQRGSTYIVILRVFAVT